MYSDYAGNGLAGACLGAESSSSGEVDASGSTTMTPGDESGTTVGTGGESGPSVEGWWDCRWERRRALSLSSFDLEVSPVDKTVLVPLDFATDDGLRFVDAAGNELAFETESELRGDVSAAWVRLPTLDADTVFFAYYDAGEVGAASVVGDVWSDEWTAVWHLEDGRDSGPQSIELSDAATAGVGVIGQGRAFDGQAQNLNGGTQAELANLFVDGATVLAWINPSAIDGGRLFGRTATDSIHGGWRVNVMESAGDDATNTLAFRHFADTTLERGEELDPRGGNWAAASNSIAVDAWQFVGVSFAGDSQEPPLIVVDGEERLVIEYGSVQGIYDDDSNDQFIVGRGNSSAADSAYPQSFSGSMDELRIAAGPMTAEELRFEYLSTSGQLVSVGEEESSPCP